MKAVNLLSGGLDSPVAAYMLMKQGCEVVLVHFQNEGVVQESVEDKIIQLAKELAKFKTLTGQEKLKLYIVPFGEIQKEIIMKVQPEMRMLVYRRFMLKISEKVAEKENSTFLITGDSLAQVASQTIENLTAVYAATKLTILTPLIGIDKVEIMDTARDIGTYDISILPYQDCCSYFVPKHPKLKSTARLLSGVEIKLDVTSLVNTALDSARELDF